jgi:cytochrome c556
MINFIRKLTEDKMKNILIALIASVLTLFGITSISAETSSFKFKQIMHHVLDDYTHARISYSLKKYDISDIFLKHVLGNLKDAPPFLPDYSMEGKKLDKESINKRLAELTQKMSALRNTVQKRELKEINKQSDEIFQMCVGCHEERRKKYLFIEPTEGKETVFQEYMHRISEEFKTASIYAESKEFNETEEYLKLINFYLGLLEGIFPERGPSGIILDRDGYVRRMKDFEKLNEDAQKNIHEKKAFDTESFKKSLNELCVACHEPERIK